MKSYLFFVILILKVKWTFGIPLFWIGGITSNSAKICLETSKNTTTIMISNSKVLWNQENIQKINITNNEYGFSCSKIENLESDTTYYYAYKENSNNKIIGNFNTFPKENTLASFKFAFGSCEKWHSKGYSWQDINKKNAEFFIHMGDLFYNDITINDVKLYRDALYEFLSGESQKNYLKEHGIVYMWDDHDYSDNNSGGWSNSRLAALNFYNEMTPHYDLKQEIDDGVYQAFTYGNVRFILTDLRSKSDNLGITTLGNVQKQWLFEELASFKNYSMVVWVSTKPWIGKHEGYTDKWYGYPDERIEISNFISENKINNLVMLAGDAHMLAIDDGSNTDYSTNNGKAGFPLMQSSPLGQYGSTKGGPYSEGCYSYRYYKNYQYAMMHIDDTLKKVCFNWYGYVTGDDDPIISFERCIDKTDPSSTWVVDGTGGEGKCPIKIFPSWISAIIGLISFILVILIVYGMGILFRKWTWKLNFQKADDEKEMIFKSV